VNDARTIVDAAPAGTSLAAAGELFALLDVGRRIARGAELTTVLDEITQHAAEVIGARTASILLLNAGNRLELAGSYGLSSGYGAFLTDPNTELRPGRGPAGLAVESGAPILIEDVNVDDRFVHWRGIAREEGYGAMLSVPLALDGRGLGAITIYRDELGPWSGQDVELLALFAAHASSAVFLAQLIAAQGRQVAALSRLVLTLREQTHEHANRLHSIGGLLALGEYDRARRFVASLESAHHVSYGTLVSRVGDLALAGLILAQTSMAEQRGISLKLDSRSNLAELPPGLGEAEAVTLLGNLLQNAIEAVAGMPRSRRRISVLVRSTRGTVVLRVRDWGVGIQAEDEQRLLERGVSTKEEHLGIGLALVREIAEALNGNLRLQRETVGTVATVTIPAGRRAGA